MSTTKIRPFRITKFKKLFGGQIDEKELNNLSKTIKTSKLSPEKKKQKTKNILNKLKKAIGSTYRRRSSRRQRQRTQRSKKEKKDEKKRRNDLLRIELNAIHRILLEEPSEETLNKISKFFMNFKNNDKPRKEREIEILSEAIGAEPGLSESIEEIEKKLSGEQREYNILEAPKIAEPIISPRQEEEINEAIRQGALEELLRQEEQKYGKQIMKKPKPEAYHTTHKPHKKQISGFIHQGIPEEEKKIELVKPKVYEAELLPSKKEIKMKELMNALENAQKKNEKHPGVWDKTVKLIEEKIKLLEQDKLDWLSERQLEYDIFGYGHTSSMYDDEMALSDKEINEIMDYNENYLGTFALDEVDEIIDIIKKLKYEKFSFIINNKPLEEFEEDENLIGHWIAVWCDTEDGEFCIFDPLAEIDEETIDEIALPFKEYFEKTQNHYLKLKINRIPEQAAYSHACGWFCIRFIHMMDQDIPFKQATGYTNIKENEEDVEQLKERYEKFQYI